MLSFVARVFHCVSFGLSSDDDVARRKGGQIDSHAVGDVYGLYKRK